MRRKPVHLKVRPIDKEIKIEDQAKILWKNPIVKGVAIAGALYGVLCISKYIIKEYAEVVAATKKLRDANRL